jgi:tetratricopeptide (TPR) repeat protein
MRALRFFCGFIAMLNIACWCQQLTTDWHTQVREYAKAEKWDSAISVINGELTREPQNPELLEWRARLLLWAGQLDEAALEWKHVLTIAPDDPDNWMALGSVYWRHGNPKQALIAVNKALDLDPNRADAHVLRGRALLALQDSMGARREFQRATELDPGNQEAKAAFDSVKEPARHQLLIGSENDLFSFAGSSQQNEISLSSRWSEHWATAFAESFYLRDGIDASKFQASTTFNSRRWGALTLGGSLAHDNGIIPTHEAFFGYDRGFRLTSTPVLRGLELIYGQHWYWYRSARVLGIGQTAILYLPHDWTWSLSLTAARSEFGSTPLQWSPSESSRLQFPIFPSEKHRVDGNLLFACGREDFSQVDQIGSFSSHTYGGGLGFQIRKGQDLKGFAAYETRTNHQSEIGFGARYGIRF